MTFEEAVISKFRDLPLEKQRAVFDFIEFLLVREEQTPNGTSGAIAQTSPPSPLKNTVLRYDEPFEPATSLTDWDALA